MGTAMFLFICCLFVCVSTATPTCRDTSTCQVYPEPCHVKPETIPHGIVSQVTDSRQQVALAFNCINGFVLQGKAILTCCGQMWEDIFPTCAPLDCKGHYDSGKTTSGSYLIYPGGRATLVYCDMTGQGGGWTVIQRRKDASVGFYRKWADYKAGFGHVNANFWIGLDNLHDLTSATNSEIYIYMKASSSENAFARYSTFWVAGEADNYRLSVDGYDSLTSTAGDSLANENNAMFTTLDADHDTYSKANCALLYMGGWWYNECHHSNPNGLYLNGPHPGRQYAQGIEWLSYKGHYHSMIHFEMKIRRKI